MRKEHAMAIFIGAIMVASAGGYALMGINFNQPGQSSVPSIVTKELTKDEKVSLWRSGKTLLQYHYPLNCASCTSARTELESFAKNMADYVVLEEFAIPDNETLVFKMISPNGEMRDEELAGVPVNQSMLLDNFCSISYVQTKDCLLRGFGSSEVNVTL